jgi:pyruvate dehydrogenase E2 component (dihydrolipoamide acetyltransferase)
VTAKQVLVPDIGNFKDVDVIEVLVAAGDHIKREDPLITLESDKATMDVPAPQSGVVREVKAHVGDKVSSGSLILTLDVEPEREDGDGAANAAAPTPPMPAPVQAPQVKGAQDLVSAPAPATPSPAHPPQEMVDVSVPDIGNFKDVDIIEVHVKPGDRVKPEDPLITLESDKATMDVPAPEAGVVKEVGIKVGDKVSAGSRILTLQRSESSGPAPPETDESDVQPVAAPAEAAVPREGGPGPSPTAAMALAPGEAGRKPHASPSVRRFARELGVDLAKVGGTGPKGRILKEDVQTFVKQVLVRPGVSAGVGLALPEMPEVDFSAFGEIERQPLSRIKKISGPHLHRSWVSVPHVTQHDEADITELEAFRKELADEAKAKGVRLTLLAFLLKACVGALKQYPYFNASLDRSGEAIILKKYYHIGVAVDTPEGLVVPVIRDVDKKGVFGLAAELGEASAKARDRKLAPNDLQGGCFTISSLGGIGGIAFTPIVNAPEVAILGVSRARMQPVYRDGAFVPRLMLPLSLSYDHRVIDGAQAARFTSYLGLLLADVRRLLL